MPQSPALHPGGDESARECEHKLARNAAIAQVKATLNFNDIITPLRNAFRIYLADNAPGFYFWSTVLHSSMEFFYLFSRGIASIISSATPHANGMLGASSVVATAHDFL